MGGLTFSVLQHEQEINHKIHEGHDLTRQVGKGIGWVAEQIPASIVTTVLGPSGVPGLVITGSDEWTLTQRTPLTNIVVTQSYTILE